MKADGTKFGKTESETVWLDPGRTSPYQLYQFFLQAEDAVVGDYLRYFTFLSHERLGELDAQVAEHPERREAQRALATEVCTLVHGAAEAQRAERASRALFGEEIADLDETTLLDVVREAPSGTRRRAELGRLGLVEALASSGLVASKSEARRAITQGGVYVNNRRQRDPETVLSEADLLHDRYLLLRRGRRDYYVLRFD